MAETQEAQAIGEITPENFNLPAASLAVDLTRAEIDQAIATAKAYPRSLKGCADAMTSMATFDEQMAEDCIYSLPRAGKMIRGPSIRFAEIVAANWGNCRHSARVTHVDRIERYVEAEAAFFDLQTNVASVARVKRTIELKKNKTVVDPDMVQLAGAAGMQIARRNAILGGVPRIVWGQAYAAVEDVIRGDAKTLSERRTRAVDAFVKMGVSADRVAKALEKEHIEDIDLDDLVTMTGWRSAIKSGDATIDEIFPEERPATAKKTLAQKLEAAAAPLENAPDPTPAPQSDAGEASPPPGEASPPLSAAASSNAEPGKPAADAPAPAAGDRPQEAARKPKGGHPEKAAIPLAGDGAKAAPSPAKGAEAIEAKRAALQARGDAAAAKGEDALMEWIDNLSGDETAMITPAMEKRWKDAVE